MNKQGEDIDNTKNKVVGGIKETAGKVTDNEQLELKEKAIHKGGSKEK